VGSRQAGGRDRSREPITLEVDAVVFDCDGVLVDSAESVERCWRRWAEQVGLSADAVPAEIHGRTSRATAEALLPPEMVDDAAALMERLEIDDAASVRAVPGAQALLAAVPAGRWAVVTSGTRPLFSARMAAAGLAVPAIAVTADVVARSKPDPAGYALALRLLDVDPGRAVVLEDAVPGILAARAAGVRWVVRVGPGARVSGEDAVIGDLRQARWTGGLQLTGDVWGEPGPAR
jgi:mannitol-1-/sugar-/sorbitol-6-phosphatase